MALRQVVCVHSSRAFVSMRADSPMCIGYVMDRGQSRVSCFKLRTLIARSGALSSWLLRLFLDLRNRSNRSHAIDFSLLYIHLYTAVKPNTVRDPCHNPSNETKWPMTKWSAKDSAACKKSRISSCPKPFPFANNLHHINCP